MSALLKFLRLKSNREVLTWVGGGIAAAVAAAWTAFIYLWPISAPETKKGAASTVEAKCGGVAIGGNLSGSVVTGGSVQQSKC
jgi:hypothetical protein